MARRIRITTPLGEALQFRQLRGHEALSELFELEVDLLAEDKNIDPKALLGQGASVSIQTQSGGLRHIDGIVTRFGLQGQDHRHYSYRATLRPWLWLASLKSDFRIFQFKTVPDILREVLGRYGKPFELQLARSYRAWEYCVQYGESDHAFMARLCEHEGIYWYHRHEAGQHTLVLVDDIESGHKPLPGGAAIPFHPPEKAAVADKESIHTWQVLQDVHPGRHANDDYDFKKPRADLANMRQNPPGHAHDGYEQYEWPGGYTEFADGETYARLRLEEHLSPRHRARASSNRAELGPGYTLQLQNHPRQDQNQTYLILATHYDLHENPQVSEGSGQSGSQQKFQLVLQPKTIPYRPQRTTPKPRTHGPQTAVVVGPAGEEIWTDQYGRIKVQFHWDRLGNNDENSSCWVRVSTSWAGPNFGAVFVPRIGMEVIIDFLSGDPDYPILTGCVYNAQNMPPWGLPDNATQSGLLTRSSKGGAPGAGMKNGAGDANAIRFEDKAGQEQLWLHAQKDQLTEVEHDEDKWVGNDRRKTVDGHETNVIHKNRTETVDLNETVTIGINRSVTIGGNKTETISGAKAETVALAKALSIGGAYQVSVGAAMNETVGGAKLTEVAGQRGEVVGLGKSLSIGKTYALKAGDEIALNSGASTLSMKSGGSVDLAAKEIRLHTGGGYILIKDSGSIEISGSEITIKTAGGQVHIDSGGVIQVAGTDTTMKAGAGKVSVDPGGIVDIKGPMVKINT